MARDDDWGENPWVLICERTSEGWTKVTKAMEIEGCGCLVQVSMQQATKDRDGGTTSHNASASVAFVPCARIDSKLNDKGEVISRSLSNMYPTGNLK